MDSSWLEILPLPKSRPGWMATIFMAILGVVIFWTIQPKLFYYAQEHYYFKTRTALRDGISIEVTYPHFIGVATQYNIELSFSNPTSETLAIEAIEVIQYNASSGQTAQRTINTVDVKLRPKETFIYTFSLATPSFAYDGSRVVVEPEINTSGYQPDLPFSNYHGIVDVDRWSALQLNIFQSIVNITNGIILITLLAMISVWITEYKNHQDVWLSTKEGWDIVRGIFFKAVRIFLSLLLLIAIIFGFPKELSLLGAIALSLGFAVWLFKPELIIIKNWFHNFGKRLERLNLDHQPPSQDKNDRPSRKNKISTSKKLK